MSRKDKRISFSGLDIKGLDSDVRATLLQGAVANKAALTAKQKRDRQRTRVRYDIAPTVKAAVEQIAKKEDTSASQIGEVLLVYGLLAYLRKDDELMQAMSMHTRKRSRTPRFYWDMELPQTWLLALEAYLAETKKPQKWGE